MPRLVRAGTVLLMVALACVAVPAAQKPSSGRPLKIEDYYRVQTIGSRLILAQRQVGHLHRLDSTRRA